jgi:hypothetical protein
MTFQQQQRTIAACFVGTLLALAAPATHAMGSGSLFSNGLNGFCGERKQMPRCGHQPCTPVAPQLHPAPLNSRKGGHKSLRPRALPAGFIAPCLPELSHAAAIGGRLISSVPILQFPMLLAMAALISAFAASG